MDGAGASADPIGVSDGVVGDVDNGSGVTRAGESVEGVAVGAEGFVGASLGTVVDVWLGGGEVVVMGILVGSGEEIVGLGVVGIGTSVTGIGVGVEDGDGVGSIVVGVGGLIVGGDVVEGGWGVEEGGAVVGDGDTAGQLRQSRR